MSMCVEPRYRHKLKLDNGTKELWNSWELSLSIKTFAKLKILITISFLFICPTTNGLLLNLNIL